MILRGKALQDEEDGDDLYVTLKEEDSLIVAVIPNPPAGAETYDDDDDELKFKIHPSTSLWKKKLYYFMRNKLKLPCEFFNHLHASPSKNILGTGFSIILLNLGKRQPGDVSAYSIFNEDFRELPGTYNADRIDQDIRTGRI